MNRDLLREIIIKLEAISSNSPNVINTGIEAKLDELIEVTKQQNKISERMIKALETQNSKNSIQTVVDTTEIEEKLDNIWEILYDTKNNINS
jgi:uncharacterized protein YqgV (UPF0045/DUF77 family)